SGNVTAGKYNDGNPVNCRVLAERLAAGMKAAWQATTKFPVTAADLDYRVRPTALPPYRTVDPDRLRAVLADDKSTIKVRAMPATQLAWLSRCQAGHKMDLTCLHLGPAWILHMPGELFIEYQLAAQRMKPDATICMAAYGDCGPWYIGTAA